LAWKSYRRSPASAPPGFGPDPLGMAEPRR
jgi:hypothetical protein